MRRIKQGFSLIELLVVVAIVAMITGAAFLAMGNANIEQRSKIEADRLAALLELACERAALSGRRVGMVVTARDVHFQQQERDRWVPMRDADLRRRELPETMRWQFDEAMQLREQNQESLTVENASKRAPSIQCFASGEMTPFLLNLGLAAQKPFWQVRGEIDGRVQITALHQP